MVPKGSWCAFRQSPAELNGNLLSPGLNVVLWAALIFHLTYVVCQNPHLHWHNLKNIVLQCSFPIPFLTRGNLLYMRILNNNISLHKSLCFTASVRIIAPHITLLKCFNITALPSTLPSTLLLLMACVDGAERLMVTPPKVCDTDKAQELLNDGAAEE